MLPSTERAVPDPDRSDNGIGDCDSGGELGSRRVDDSPTVSSDYQGWLTDHTASPAGDSAGPWGFAASRHLSLLGMQSPAPTTSSDNKASPKSGVSKISANHDYKFEEMRPLMQPIALSVQLARSVSEETLSQRRPSQRVASIGSDNDDAKKSVMEDWGFGMDVTSPVVRKNPHSALVLSSTATVIRDREAESSYDGYSALESQVSERTMRVKWQMQLTQYPNEVDLVFGECRPSNRMELRIMLKSIEEFLRIKGQPEWARGDYLVLCGTLRIHSRRLQKAKSPKDRLAVLKKIKVDIDYHAVSLRLDSLTKDE